MNARAIEFMTGQLERMTDLEIVERVKGHVKAADTYNKQKDGSGHDNSLEILLIQEMQAASFVWRYTRSHRPELATVTLEAARWAR